jgi:adenylate cyclase
MERKQAAVLFSDICGSTSYFEKYGEVAGGKMVRACRTVVGNAILAEGGELRPVGDHLAVSVAAAAAIVAGKTEDPVRIHSGAAFGTVVIDDSGDVFGDVMNVAARICDLAGPDQFYVTKTLAGRLSEPNRGETRVVGSFPVRGKAANVEVLEVLWQKEGVTARAPSDIAAEESWAELRFGDQVARLAPDRRKLKLGRGTANDVVVTDRAVSREHAEVIHRRGRCYLVDRSTNGTYLRPGRRKPHHLHREELVLEGEGTFSLGRADGPPVSYKIV